MIQSATNAFPLPLVGQRYLFQPVLVDIRTSFSSINIDSSWKVLRHSKSST